MLAQPEYVKSAGIVGAPIKYKWNNDRGMDLDDVQNDRLYDAVDASSFRAKMALAAVLTEWIAWRFDGHTDVTDALMRVEAAWAAVVDASYSKDLEIELVADDDSEPVKAPLESALNHLSDAHDQYVNGSIYLAEPVMKLGMLARHVAPDKKRFDHWLSATLARTAKVFPRGAPYDEDSETYDASAEPPVPRAFFEGDFQYTPAAAKAAITRFLQHAKPAQNPYLAKR